MPETADDLVARARKRADQIELLPSDPSQPHPDATLLRELASALAVAKTSSADRRAHADADLAAAISKITGTG